MSKFNLRYVVLWVLLLLLIAIGVTVLATAQERPARTWATVGATITKSTARESAPVIVGLDVCLAYDLRHGLQVIGEGEYRSAPAIRRLFTGYLPNRAQSEMRYRAKLNYHFPVEGRVRPFIGGGVSVIRQFFDDPFASLPGQALYDSSVNPTISAGAAVGKRGEIVFTKYLGDTYSYSNLRGWGVDFANTRKVSERVYLRSGMRLKRWTFYEGEGHYDKRAIEAGGFVGFQFQ